MEKRKNVRVPFQINSVVRYEGSEMEGRVLNVSLRGMFINIPECLPLNSQVQVELLLTGQTETKSLSFISRVIRSNHEGTAIKVMDLNLDACIALRDLMIDNKADADVIMEEFYDFVHACKS